MSDTLDLDSPRLTVKKPATREDAQGQWTDAERTERAMRAFVKDYGATASLYLESCIHCGMCADACHFFVTTEDPKYTPIWKVEPFKKAYKREYGPFAWFYRALNLKAKVDADELMRWQELMYDSCTLCGRCSLICPMGIDIAGLVGLARHGMAKAGLVPHELAAAMERGAAEGSPYGATVEVFRERLQAIQLNGRDVIPLDRERADVLATVTAVDVIKYPETIAAMARVLNHLGVNWTFSSLGYEATNVGVVAGDMEWQRAAMAKIVRAARQVGAKTVLLPECGHAYGALRWQADELFGEALPFEVKHIAEFLGEQARAGRLKLRPMGTAVTFHDPCQVVRRGGVKDEPREVIRALGAQLVEMQPNTDTQWCCGGGGGVIANHRADKLRLRVYQIKMNQFDKTGVDTPVTTCSNCRQTFDDGQAHYRYDKTVRSLVELVADHLDGDAR